MQILPVLLEQLCAFRHPLALHGRSLPVSGPSAQSIMQLPPEARLLGSPDAECMGTATRLAEEHWPAGWDAASAADIFTCRSPRLKALFSDTVHRTTCAVFV